MLLALYTYSIVFRKEKAKGIVIVDYHCFSKLIVSAYSALKFLKSCLQTGHVVFDFIQLSIHWE